MTGGDARVVRLRLNVSNNAAVAQRIRASVYGTEGRGFESLQPHHLKANKDLDDGGPQGWCRCLIGVVIVFIDVFMAPRTVFMPPKVVNKRSQNGVAITAFHLPPWLYL